MHGASGLFLEGFLPSCRDLGPGLQDGDRILCMEGHQDPVQEEDARILHRGKETQGRQ